MLGALSAVRRAIAACLWMIGCAPPATKPAELRAHSAAGVERTPPPTAPALPPSLEVPQSVACTLRANDWPYESVEDPGKGHYFLRFASSMRPFAQVLRGTHVSLVLPIGEASAGGTLSLDADGVTLRGIFAADEMPLYPASAFVLSGVFVPNEERRLEWRSGKAGTLVVAWDAGPKVHATTGELSGERPCADLSLGAVRIEPKAIDQATGGPSSDEPAPPWKWLRVGKVPLASTPDGAAIVEIDSTEPPNDTLLVHPVRVMAAGKDRTRIALSAFGGTLFGWVPTARLRSAAREFVDLQHDSSFITAAGPPKAGAFIACSREMPLVAEVDGERRHVGSVHAGGALEKVGDHSGWTEIAFRDPGIAAAPGAVFLVREADLVGCGPARAAQD
jgi:hypothetical protein